MVSSIEKRSGALSGHLLSKILYGPDSMALYLPDVKVDLKACIYPLGMVQQEMESGISPFVADAGIAP
jgi:hypothetical protein